MARPILLVLFGIAFTLAHVACSDNQARRTRGAPPVGRYWCDESSEAACPIGSICTDAPWPVGPCRIPGDTVNVPANCRPVACAAYRTWGVSGGGGTGAFLCAEACEARCRGAAAASESSAAEAWRDYGMACEF